MHPCHMHFGGRHPEEVHLIRLRSSVWTIADLLGDDNERAAELFDLVAGSNPVDLVAGSNHCHGYRAKEKKQLPYNTSLKLRKPRLPTRMATELEETRVAATH